MITAANLITGIAVGFAGATAALAATVQAGREHRAEPAPQPRPAPDAHVPCHDLACAHMTMPHDRTPAGLVCRGCRTTKEAL